MKTITKERLLSSFSHILSGFVPFVIGFLLTQSFWIGTLCVFMYFWSREKCQHQYLLKGDKPTYTVWNKGWFPWEWSFASQLDLYIPVAFYSLLSLLF
jgi:hypothetical protein